MILVNFGGAKMKIQYLIPVVLIATLVLGAVGVTAFEDRTIVKQNRFTRAVNQRILRVNEKLSKVDPEKLKEKIPGEKVVLEELDAIEIPRRFILWTHDGKSVMWGTYGNGYFRGKDNHGKYTWGIYGRSVFAGFYNGKFFWGHYRRGFWKAEGLFGLNAAHGRYVTFPSVYPIPVTVEGVGG